MNARVMDKNMEDKGHFTPCSIVRQAVFEDYQNLTIGDIKLNREKIKALYDAIPGCPFRYDVELFSDGRATFYHDTKGPTQSQRIW